jgi:ATP adenylyltransferase
MFLNAELLAPAARFAWILQGASRGPDDTFDEDLADFAEAAVIPTRGALVSEWLLIVPRRPCLSMAELAGPDRARLLAISNAVSARVSALVGSFVTFEHGPGRRGSATGCGVDQAHLHVVGGGPDLLDRLVAAVDDAAWSVADHADPWRSMPAGSDYLMIRDRERAVRALIDSPTSQRLRRAIAPMLGREHEWDYRAHPHEANARRTKEIFRGAFADASS